MRIAKGKVILFPTTRVRDAVKRERAAKRRRGRRRKRRLGMVIALKDAEAQLRGEPPTSNVQL